MAKVTAKEQHLQNENLKLRQKNNRLSEDINKQRKELFELSQMNTKLERELKKYKESIDKYDHSIYFAVKRAFDNAGVPFEPDKIFDLNGNRSNIAFISGVGQSHYNYINDAMSPLRDIIKSLGL